MDVITAFDEYGREMQIPREAWRTEVLPSQLRQHWQDPDELYGAIVMALQDGFVAEVADASAHLVEIESTERSHTVRGIILMKLGRLSEAELVFRSYLERAGASGVILTNLAKVYAEQGKSAASEDTLWKALETDPNQDNGLSWWGAIHRERGGEAGFVSAMERASGIAGSWRPQLWLARARLEAKDLVGARRLYEHVLKLAPDDPDAMMMLSGDLGNHGYVEEMVQLVMPIYRPQVHGPMAGINLVEACLQLGRREDAERILEGLFQLNLPHLRQALMAISARVDTLKKNAIPSSPPAAAPRILALDRPVWTGGLKTATWLLPDPMGPNVGLLALSDSTVGGSGPIRSGPESERGRLTRSIPLFLAEHLLFGFEARTCALIPVVPQGGPVVAGQVWSDDSAVELASKTQPVPDFVVTGNLGDGITLVILDLHRGTRIGTVERPDAIAHLPDLAKELQRLLGLIPRRHQSYVEFPGPTVVENYLQAEAQGLALALVSIGLAPYEALWGERNVLDWFLRLALGMGMQVPKIMFVSGLAQSRKFGSRVYLEFRQQALTLLSDEKDPHAPFRRLSPLIYKLFEMPDELARAKTALMDAAGDQQPYRKWLERL